jgi:hypothetical protein
MDARRARLAMSLAGLVIATAAPAAAEEFRLVVRVYNVPELPLTLVSGATQGADRVLRQAGVDTEWVICSGSADVADRRCFEDITPLDVVVRLIDGTAPSGEGVCGVAVRPPGRGAGQLLSLFVPCIRRLADGATVRERTVMAYCLVHELGHLLLPTAAHAPYGVMASSLSVMEWRSATAGRLWFSDREAVLLRNGVAARAAVAVATAAARAR